MVGTGAQEHSGIESALWGLEASTSCWCAAALVCVRGSMTVAPMSTRRMVGSQVSSEWRASPAACR